MLIATVTDLKEFQRFEHRPLLEKETRLCSVSPPRLYPNSTRLSLHNTSFNILTVRKLEENQTLQSKITL